MDIIYKWLVEYVGDEKIVVNYIYVMYVLLDRYWKRLYDFVDVLKDIDEKFLEILHYFSGEKFDKKDMYNLLMYVVSKTNYNVFNVKLWKWVNISDIHLTNWEIVIDEKNDDVWFMLKTADWKIFKRFVMDDVRKLLL